ncbi:MAG: hypothetical protein WDZ89_01000 [Gemmatimonadota bacterium]
MIRIAPCLSVCLAFLLLSPLPSEAQSLLSSGGFGIPVEPFDARARGMGSVGIGLFGGYVLPTDPSAAAELRLPTITASLQPTSGTIDFNGVSGESSGSRFPLLGVGYPVGERTVATLSFGSYLDQRWRAQSESTIVLAGENVSVTDAFTSDGGLSTIRIGAARRLTDQFAVGITGGVHTGELTRSFVRTFQGLPEGEEIQPFETTGSWQMQAPTVAVGAHWDFQEFFRLAGSVTWSGSLEISDNRPDADEVRKLDLPVEYRLGASAILTSRVSMNAGVGYADWTDAGAALEEGESTGAVWNFGGGLEWEGPTLIGRSFPIRLGYHRGDLPFEFGGSAPSESALSGGFAINFSQVENIPLARLDVAVERGTREAGALSESFWRSTFSLRLSGR